MAGRGPTPKPASRRRTRHAQQRGEWQASPGIGWQHGPLPSPPPRLLKASRETWSIWMQAWFASHWTPDLLPGLRTVIRLYDQVERGAYQRASELRLQEDTYGITPKGQQDRRWTPPWMQPKVEDEPPTPGPTPNRYRHLKVINE